MGLPSMFAERGATGNLSNKLSIVIEANQLFLARVAALSNSSSNIMTIKGVRSADNCPSFHPSLPGKH